MEGTNGIRTTQRNNIQSQLTRLQCQMETVHSLQMRLSVCICLLVHDEERLQGFITMHSNHFSQTMLLGEGKGQEGKDEER